VRALVTGASGLVGSRIVRALLSEGHSVRALIRRVGPSDALDGLPVELVTGDVRDPVTLTAACDSRDVVFHAAANYAYSGERTAGIEETAVQGTVNVLGAARRAGVSRVVVTSSSVVFGADVRPIVRDEAASSSGEEGESPYVVSKLRQDALATALAAELGLSLVVVCPTVCVGPRSAALGPSNGLIVTYLSDPWRLTYPGGCNIVAAADVGTAHVLLAERGVSGERYLVGSENLEWSEVHRLVSELCGLPAPRARATQTACVVAAAVEEIRATLSGRAPLTTRHEARMLGRYYWYSDEKARRLGYAPRSARTALAEAIGWRAASRHVSREVRTQMLLTPEVFEARARIAREEAALTQVA
jgi:dihydroflavonol-4-reductase